MKKIVLCINLFTCIFLIKPLISSATTVPYWQILDNEESPIKGAHVVIYSKNKSINKKLVTDSKGFVPQQFLSPIPPPWTLIISSPGFITKTLLNIKKQNKTLRIFLKRKEVYENILTGKASQFLDVRRDGLVDFGLTMFSLNLSEIWNITPTNFFSTTIVPVPTFSRIQVPANVSFPNQKERYWISIRLQKEQYELSIPKKKNYTVHTLHGQFPLKVAIKKIQGGNSFISLANLFKFKAYSSEKGDFTSNKNKNVNFDLSKKIINGTIKVHANVDIKQQEILLFSLLKTKNQYLPFDMKRLNSTLTSTLAIPKDDKNKAVLGLLTRIGTEKVVNKELKNQSENSIKDNNLPESLNLSDIDILISMGYNMDNIEEIEDIDKVITSARLMRRKAKKTQTQSKFLTAKQLSIALQNTETGQVDLKFLPLVATPKIHNRFVSLQIPQLPKDFKMHSSLLQLVELKEIFIDQGKQHKIMTTSVLEEVGISKWAKDFNIDFIYSFKRDPKKRYAVQIIFLATTNQSSTPSHATRSLQEFL